ncbi:hypothetical protein BGZ63DRAFT_406698 [Mariannaea sp. PMI_226]|nr:hypothetical protein BGZ63DRAFT_406698 [Mariannaea sp. PMI_226]
MTSLRAPVYFPDNQLKGCILKVLPRDQWAAAAKRAFEINPANAPMLQMLARDATEGVISPNRLALLTSKYWQSSGVQLTVTFLDNPPANFRARVLSHMNAWRDRANVAFVETTSSGQIRISQTANAGHWSYLGTDILSVPINEPTMNLDSLTMDTSDQEFARVVRHQTGHTLGLAHEHFSTSVINLMDREKVIGYFNMTQGWSREDTIAQILTPHSSSALAAMAEVDSQSIMGYWLPGHMIQGNTDIRGGWDISARDEKFVRKLYPKDPSWELLDTNSNSVSITVDGSTLYQLHGNGRMWKYTGPAISGWTELDNNSHTKKLAASNGHLYQLHNDGKIWKYNGTPYTGWDLIDTNSATIDIVADGDDLYQLHNTGLIWKYNGVPISGWDNLDNNRATRKIAASKGNLYQLHSSGLIWKYTGVPMTGWQCIDTNSATTDIVAQGDDIYQLHKTGLIFRYEGVPVSGWQCLDNNSATKAIIAGPGRLYQMHSNGKIWQYVGVPIAGWKLLDQSPDSKAIAAGNELYQIRGNGQILRYLEY